jgi:rare lipoprotein A (peptidoglycan hydrolase)
MRIATMRAKLFILLESVFLGLGLLILTPSINPTPSAKTSSPAVQSRISADAAHASQAKAGSKSGPQPIAVWTCITSWYGEDFDGQPTATGETYDMYADTAAHPTLPLGSIVRVTNPRNHRSQIVRINDRGPYVEGRELDVSYAVAQKLGFDQRGTARVRLELLQVPKRQSMVRNY